MVAVRAVLFDFFGTLVTYEPNRLNLDYAATASLLHEWGFGNACERFADVWNAVSRDLELVSSASHAEFSMDDVADAYNEAEQLGLTAARRSELLDSFMAEWIDGVKPIDGLPQLLATLGTNMLLGIVSNTHQPTLVPELLRRFGLDRFAPSHAFDPLVLSVTHGQRKPHPSIYVAAFGALSARQRRLTPAAAPLEAAEVLFVGDNYDADYAGPRAAGFQARLIDPHRLHGVPEAHRLDSILELVETV